MDSDEQSNIKYPKSVNNVQCIGPCYAAGSTIIHPVTLEEISLPNSNFCPVDTIIITNPETGEKVVDTIDFCYMPTITQKDKHMLDQEIRKKLLAPTFKFSTTYFLKIYYDIGSLEEGIEWLDNNVMIPFRTRERVFNQMMTLYGDNMSIADHRIINFVRELMIRNIISISQKVSQYIDIRDDKIVLTSPDPNRDIGQNKSKVNLINSYIKTKFLGDSEIGRFVSKFVRYGSEQIKQPNLSQALVERMIEYIIKRIEASL